MTSADIQRKINQLDNDVTSIYELLSSIQATQRRHTNRFDEQDQKLTRILEILENRSREI